MILVLLAALVLVAVFVRRRRRRPSVEELSLAFYSDGTSTGGEPIIGWEYQGCTYSSVNEGELWLLEQKFGRSLRSPLVSEPVRIPLWEWPVLLLMLPFVWLAIKAMEAASAVRPGRPRWLAMKPAKAAQSARPTKILSGPGYAIEVDAETEEPVDILWHQSTRQVMNYPPKP